MCCALKISRFYAHLYLTVVVVVAAGEQGGSSSSSAAKRFRTHLSQAQVKTLKHCFRDCRNPNLGECEIISAVIGLEKRVVQVRYDDHLCVFVTSQLLLFDEDVLST